MVLTGTISLHSSAAAQEAGVEDDSLSLVLDHVEVVANRATAKNACSVYECRQT